MYRAKRKSAFEHAQNAQIQIILRIRKVLSGVCSPFIHSVVSDDCLRTVKALIRLRGCAG